MSWEEEAVLEVSEHLWRLVGQYDHVSSTSWEAFNDLANLDVESAVLRSRLAVLRQIDTEKLITSLEVVVRGLPSSINFRTSVDSRGPYGRIRWAETTVTRVRSGSPELVVHSQVIRDYDRPLNRAVKSTLAALVEILDAAERAAQHLRRDQVFEFLGVKPDSLEDLRSRALVLLNTPKIAGARKVEVVSDEQWERLVERGANECLLNTAIQKAFSIDPPLRDVIDVIISDLVKPGRGSDLMELMVAVRLARALERLGLTLQPLQLRRAEQPFASLVDENGKRWEIYWQSSPWVVPSLGWDRELSVYGATRVANHLKDSPLRPDCLVVGPDKRAILVEVKSTKNQDKPRYRDGILDAMAYLRDTEAYTSEGPVPKAIAVVQHATANWDGNSPIAVSGGEITSLANFIQLFWADRLTPPERNEAASA